MSFGSFLEYVQLYDGGELWHDLTYKNYDLLHGVSGNVRLRRALAEAGFNHQEISVSLAECVTRLRERGYASLSESEVQGCLLEWTVWHRINSGEYKTWKYRK